ncbi:hypothetical protein QR680_001432 [Steinernema hermaphroditum]|uniref:CCHC-type domain-containing protein n=1 Tax=Steinernema hermaphroditum TaxID=289476 RepID=A0AA39GYD5_9BILA|nr:hypothetical protein QR680_001432 [Steinernema hermaphroditum]
MSHLPTSSAVVHDQEDTEGGARDTTERLLNVIARLESRKRPFRQGGTSGGRPGTAFNQESGLVKQLCMQVNSLQQQVSAGYGYQAPPPRAPIRQSGPPFCFLCKGYGHFVKQCPQGPAGRQ